MRKWKAPVKRGNKRCSESWRDSLTNKYTIPGAGGWTTWAICCVVPPDTWNALTGKGVYLLPAFWGLIKSIPLVSVLNYWPKVKTSPYLGMYRQGILLNIRFNYKFQFIEILFKTLENLSAFYLVDCTKSSIVLTLSV